MRCPAPRANGDLIGGATQQSEKQNASLSGGVLIAAFPREGNGAGEAIRTPDPNLGKVVLYP